MGGGACYPLFEISFSSPNCVDLTLKICSETASEWMFTSVSEPAIFFFTSREG